MRSQTKSGIIRPMQQHDKLGGGKEALVVVGRDGRRLRGTVSCGKRWEAVGRQRQGKEGIGGSGDAQAAAG